MTEETKKNVDESWKDAVAKEKENDRQEDISNDEMQPEPTFNFFVSTLALQASVFLGQIPDPVSNKKIKNINQAKFIIDTLDMLKNKTANNLTTEEGNLIENILYELKMQYVSVNKENKSGLKD